MHSEEVIHANKGRQCDGETRKIHAANTRSNCVDSANTGTFSSVKLPKTKLTPIPPSDTDETFSNSVLQMNSGQASC